jgi:hypothetical protein
MTRENGLNWEISVDKTPDFVKIKYMAQRRPPFLFRVQRAEQKTAPRRRRSKGIF